MTRPQRLRRPLTLAEQAEADSLREKLKHLERFKFTTSARAIRRKLRALLGRYDPPEDIPS